MSLSSPWRKKPLLYELKSARLGMMIQRQMQVSIVVSKAARKACRVFYAIEQICSIACQISERSVSTAVHPSAVRCERRPVNRRGWIAFMIFRLYRLNNSYTRIKHRFPLYTMVCLRIFFVSHPKRISAFLSMRSPVPSSNKSAAHTSTTPPPQST